MIEFAPGLVFSSDPVTTCSVNTQLFRLKRYRDSHGGNPLVLMHC